MAIITSALLLCLLAIPPSSPPLLRVDMDFKGLPMRPRLEAAAMEEVTLIWAAYGVDVQKLNPNDAAREDAVRLSVVLADHADRRMTAAGALGSILFLDDSPEPTILMYPNAIEALVADVRMSEHPSSEWPLALQDAIRGRVLGRALAHELGHFLLRSRQHAEVGLMRPRQSVFDLVAAGRQSFFLSADETKRLWSVTSSPTWAPDPY